MSILQEEGSFCRPKSFQAGERMSRYVSASEEAEMTLHVTRDNIIT